MPNNIHPPNPGSPKTSSVAATQPIKQGKASRDAGNETNTATELTFLSGVKQSQSKAN
jgi:hypothetical protein